MPKLTVQLVTWNGAKYLPYLFASLRAQTLHDWELIVIDNGSTDGTSDVLAREPRDFSNPFRFIQNSDNVGFAAGHNQAMKISNFKFQISNSPSEYIQLLNQDVLLAPDYFERLIAYMEEHPQCAAVQGVLCRWDFANADMVDGGRTDTIDTLGLKVFRNRRVVDWMTGVHRNELQAPIEVFGISGALPMYRRAALEDVAIDGQVFDEEFFSYKEDVDLAFRLRLAGWHATIVPAAQAWHDRTAAGPSDLSDAAAANDRRTKSAFVRFHSYKNHLFVLIKNEQWSTFWRDAPMILWYEWKKFIYLLFREPRTLRAFGDIVRQLPSMARKRRVIMTKRRVSGKEMRRWFT